MFSAGMYSTVGTFIYGSVLTTTLTTPLSFFGKEMLLWRELNNSRGFECFVGAVFVERADALRGEGYNNRAVELRHKNALFLEVWLLADAACGVEFGSTNTVAVAASNLRTLFCDWANFGHEKIKVVP